MREKEVVGNIYHVLSRGVDKRNIFLDNKDRYRFIHNLFEFNDINPSVNNWYRFNSRPIDFASRYMKEPRKLLVDILAFCLMPNHYHLLIKPRVVGGLLKFLRRLNIGYVKYFNDKHKRKGALFEGRYKLILIADESHFIHIPYYIHLNPLDLVAPEWREKNINNHGKAIKFLESYKWSSHLDYAGIKNFPSITSREFLLEFFGGSEKYKKEIENWIKFKTDNYKQKNQFNLKNFE